MSRNNSERRYTLDSGLKTLILLLCCAAIVGLSSCSRESELVTRGPSGFCTEDMGISLKSIPHEKVDYFNGKVLVLSLSKADHKALLDDERFKWQRPPGEITSSLILGEWQLIDGDRYKVVVFQSSTNAGAAEGSWQLFALDQTRLKFVMCEDHWKFFK